MARFTLSINVDNDAFAGPDASDELARILRGIASAVELTECCGLAEAIRDINGNTVGQYQLTRLASSR